MDCAINVGGQLCNVKAVKLKGQVDNQTEIKGRSGRPISYKFRGKIQDDCDLTIWKLILHSQHITSEIMGSAGLTRVAKTHAEHLLLFSMATPASL